MHDILINVYRYIRIKEEPEESEEFRVRRKMANIAIGIWMANISLFIAYLHLIGVVK